MSEIVEEIEINSIYRPVFMHGTRDCRTGHTHGGRILHRSTVAKEFSEIQLKVLKILLSLLKSLSEQMQILVF